MIARLLLSSSTEKIREKIQETLACNLEGYRTNHPDLLYIQAGEKLGIAEARKIKDHFSFKPYSAKGRFVAIEDASLMTTEAQNALLKTIEELPKDAIFVLGSRSDANLLPTIISRCEITKLDSTSDDSLEYYQRYATDLKKLLEASNEERFVYVEKLKCREEFLHAMVYFFHQQMLEPATHERSHLMCVKDFLNKLLQAEKWAKQNVNIRTILEYLMLVMPNRSD